MHDALLFNSHGSVGVFSKTLSLGKWVLGACAVLGGVSAQAATSSEGTVPVQVPHEVLSKGVVVETVAQGLAHPWGVAVLEDGRFVVTERAGRMRIISKDGVVGAPLQGVPEVAAAGQGGLLDVVADREFSLNRRLYWCYSESDAQAPRMNSTALATGVLRTDGSGLEQVQVLFSQRPKVESALHFGCRIVQSPDGMLFLAMGERFSRSRQAQMLDNHIGKVVRLHADGRVPDDNPYSKQNGAMPEIWSWGHRNPQGAAWGPDGRLWIHEHGPQGGDEINHVVRGSNYGWPQVSNGVHYGGRAVGEGKAVHKDMATPWHVWVPSIAPSGMAFLSSDRYGPDWKGSLFVGSLKFQRLHRLEWNAKGVMREEIVLPDLGERVRDVRQGADGWLYVLTDAPQGRLLRVRREGF